MDASSQKANGTSSKIVSVSPDTLIASNAHLQKYTGPPMDPIVTPIYTSSVYRFKDIEQFGVISNNADFIFYPRMGTPNSSGVETTICSLEGGAGSVVFVSGMAAITTTFMSLLKAGDHIVAQNPVYSGVFKFINKFLPKWNVEVSWVTAGCDVTEYEKHIKPNTKLLYGETPCNPKMSILDLEAFGQLSKKYAHIVTMVDGTFASPYLQLPLKFGVDISMHSCTKYLGGHSDLMGGVVTMRTKALFEKIRENRTYYGNPLSAFDCYLLARGMKTLAVRMDRHSQNALIIAEYLQSHPLVKEVCYPGLKSHLQHNIAAKQMKSFSGMITFEINGTFEQSKVFVESTKLVNLAVSLGGVESLIEHISYMVHGPWIMSDEERKEAGLSDTLIRLSVGLENVEDIKDDLGQALQKAQTLTADDITAAEG